MPAMLPPTPQRCDQAEPDEDRVAKRKGKQQRTYM